VTFKFESSGLEYVILLLQIWQADEKEKKKTAYLAVSLGEPMRSSTES